MKKLRRLFFRSVLATLLCVVMMGTSFSAFAANVLYEEDLSGDGKIAEEDPAILRQAIVAGVKEEKYDINGDGHINVKDIICLKKLTDKFLNAEKFVAKEIKEIGNAKAVTLGTFFEEALNTKVDSSNVKVSVDAGNTGVTYIYNADAIDWAAGTIDFAGTGEVSITIYEYCIPTTIEVSIVNENQFAVNDSVAESYGNASIITVGTLFHLIDGYLVDSSKVQISAEAVDGAVSCEIVPNTENWENGKLEFDGTGTIRIRIQEESAATEIELNIVKADKFELEVNDPYTIKNTETIYIEDIFAELKDVDIDDDKVSVTIKKAQEEDTVEWKFVPNTEEWTQGYVTFMGEGSVTITIEEDSNPTTLTVNVEAVEKFTVSENVKVDLAEKDTITLGDLFQQIKGVTVDSSKVEISIENGTYIANAQDWTKGTIRFSETGTVQVTIVENSKKAVTTVEVFATYTEKFGIKFPNTENYLYRVGNGNAVALGSLFCTLDDVTIGTVSVAIEPVVNGSVTGSFTANTTDWTKETIQFSGTGPVKLTIQDNKYCIPTVLEVEVVDAVNATSATSATKNNVVLLNDCGFSSLEVSGGYTLYGNGFTMSCASDSAALDMGYAFVTLNNGTLDNVQIVCPNFDYAVLYKSNMTESGNRSETTDKTRYFNVKSGVMASGNSQILNSRISGGRAALNVSGGNVVVDNSRIELGAVASVLVGSANSLTLRDVTLVQKPTASTYDSSKMLMGFSVLFVCDANGDAAPVTLEGTLMQNAWVDENDKQYVPSAGESIISTVLAKTEYLHDIDGDGTYESLNLGFAYMPESLTSKVNTTTITDNRTNKSAVPYDYAEVSILNGKTYVYSYKNTNGTADSFKTEAKYEPNKYSDIITVNYSDVSDGLTTRKSYGTAGWVYELNVDLDKLSGYALDFSKLSMSVNGIAISDFKVDGNAKPSSPIAVVAGGITYTLTATIDGKEYIATYKVTGTETSKESPSLVASNYEAGLCVASSYGGTWHGAAPALEGIQIKYWSVAEKQYKTINLSDYTPTTAGKQNGTNTTWTYSPDNGDFTLTLTGGQVHSSNNVYAMPVVCDGKLYFVAASSNGLVNTGNSARTITVSYSFKDNNNGDALTFSHTWSVAENKDAQYKYSDFCNGTLTKLEASSGGGITECVTPDTLITLADGSQVRVDSLTGDEQLLVWNMEEGKLDSATIMFVDSDPEATYEVIKLYFSDGTEVEVISEHGFWDYDLNKYVYLDRYADKYIGHTFAKQNGDVLEKVELVDVVLENQVTTAWSPVTAGHLCYFVNGMLSMPGGVGGLFNIFDVDAETMTYDYEAMARDIETYGLFTYEELSQYAELSREMFDAAGGQYLKVSIGKGNLTEEELIAMIERYGKFFN